LNVHDNSFSAPWIQIYTTNSTINNNKFALNINNYHIVQSLIESDRGSNNQFIGNSIDGGSDAVWSTEIGADDGIFFADENANVVKNNTIQNTFNCGLETLGVISNATIDSNTIRNTGFCGIGGWYFNSWISNIVSNNIIDSAHQMFDFLQDYGLRPANYDPAGTYSGHMFPADTGVYFQNNQFINNKSSDNSNIGEMLINMSQVSAPGRNGEINPTPSQYILTNNTFKNNDFGTFFDPAFIPSSMIVDGGGNKCLTPTGAYPITCNGQITPVPQPTPTPVSTPIPVQSSATITSSTQSLSSTPIISGTASGTNQILVILTSGSDLVWNNSNAIPVVNGNWSTTVSQALVSGQYTVYVRDINNNQLTSKSLTIIAP
jgi:hypothetical protein